MNITLIIGGIVLCLVCSAFFSATEMAYSSCNRLRLENARDDGSRKAARAVKIIDRFDDALSAILIGNNLANIAGSSLASVLVMLLLGDGYAWLATLVMTVLIIIFSETMPKILAKKNATNCAIKYSGTIRVLMIVLFPLVWIVVGLVHLITNRIRTGETGESDEAVEELQSIIETAEDEAVIDEDSSELVQAAIDFADISAMEVMTARVDLQALDINSTPEELQRFVESSRYSRIPVYEDSIDNIIGVLTLNRYLKVVADHAEKPDIRSLLMPTCFVYMTMKLPQVLNLLRKEKQHLAVVCDEYGGTMGVISMEDVLETIVGDIWDEDDEFDPDIIDSSDGTYVLDGDMTISDFLELMDINEYEFEAESSTLGGWTVEMLGSFPSAGDGFDYNGLRIEVLRMDGRRVEQLRVTRPVEEPAEKE